ncbi:uncharacterized protein LOC107873793 [Capsicum annuum]|nr:uncharacterized protein LOC107873793 [Capsicum annuum]
MEEGDKNTSPHQSTPTTVEGFNKNPEGILVKDYEFVKPQLDEANKDTSPHEFTPILHHDFDKNPEGTLDKIDTSVHEARDVCDSTNKKFVDESVSEAQFSDSQNTFPDENTEAAAEIIENTSMANCEKPNLDEQINSEVHTHEAVFGEGKSQPDLRDFQVTIPDELLPSLNEYVNLERSIIVHPSANKEQTPMNVSRIKRPSKFKESPFTTKFDPTEDLSNKWEHYLKNKSKISALNFDILSVEDKNWFYVMGTPGLSWSDEQIDVCLYCLRKKSKYEPNNSYMYSTVDCNFMNIVRAVLAVYLIDDPTLNAGGKKYHLNKCISGFRMHAAVPWHTVDHIFIPINIKSKHHWVLAVLSFNSRCIYVYDSLSYAGRDSAVLAEVEKLVEVIPYCLLACKFYEKKGIDIDNYPNYKLNDKYGLFDVYIMKNLPQQPCGSLDCELYMITYTECLTFGGGVPKVDFDPDLLRTRYASMLWHYGTKKQEEKAQSDDEAPSRPRRKIQITEVTEVHDI